MRKCLIVWAGRSQSTLWCPRISQHRRQKCCPHLHQVVALRYILIGPPTLLGKNAEPRCHQFIFLECPKGPFDFEIEEAQRGKSRSLAKLVTWISGSSLFFLDASCLVHLGFFFTFRSCSHAFHNRMFMEICVF